MAGLPGIDYRCVITYKDSSTGLSITHPLTISFSRVVNGSGITDLLVTTPNGNVFKNTEVASLTAKAELWRGSTVDTTNVTYKWAIMDSSVTSSSSSGYDAAFGIGWRKLSDTTGMFRHRHGNDHCICRRCGQLCGIQVCRNGLGFNFQHLQQHLHRCGYLHRQFRSYSDCHYFHRW